jgi:hypothetical protein
MNGKKKGLCIHFSGNFFPNVFDLLLFECANAKPAGTEGQQYFAMAYPSPSFFFFNLHICLVYF